VGKSERDGNNAEREKSSGAGVGDEGGSKEAMKAKAIAHRMIQELSSIPRAVIKEVDEEIAQEDRLAAICASACDTFPRQTLLRDQALRQASQE